MILDAAKLYQQWRPKRSLKFPVVQIDLKLPIGLNYRHILVKLLLRLRVDKLEYLTIVQSLEKSQTLHLRHFLQWYKKIIFVPRFHFENLRLSS